MLKYFLLAAALFGPKMAYAYQNSPVKFYQPHELKLNGHAIKSHRIELKEVAFQNGEESLESYTYITVDPAKQMGEEMLLINWIPVTKFGTGMDLNFVSREDLRVRFRLTPKGLPWGHLIESHAFDKEVNIIEVNADTEYHLDEIKTVYPGARKLDQKPTNHVKYEAYNSIIWPYVFAAMDLKKGMEFILPGFNTYANQQFYYKLKVKGKVNFTDLKGKKHRVYEVEGVARNEMEEVRNVNSAAPGRRTTYYVTNEAPYFYGKTWFNVDEDGKKVITKSWTLVGWQAIEISPDARIGEMIGEWDKISKAENIVLPWNKR